MKDNKKKKYILSFLFSIIIFILTFYIIFSKHDLYEIIDGLRILDNKCIVISIVLMILYFLLYGLYIKIIFNSMNEKCRLDKGVLYGATEFLFNALTPGAAGGQPLAVYYMNKDGKPVNKSLIVLMLSTVLFKLTLIIGGVAILLIKPDMFVNANHFIRICFFVGLGIDIFVATFYLLVMYWSSLVRLILNFVFKIWYTIKKRKDSYKDKVEDILSQYINEAKFVKTHKGTVIFSVIIVFVLRLCLFSIVYFIYRGLGFSELSYLEMVLTQMFITIVVEPIILPGGAGISEYASSHIFAPLFGSLSTSAMLLYRSLSFYIPLIIIVVMFIIVTPKLKKNKSTN